MNAMEHKLDPTAFARIHRSAIVNLSFIDEITRTFADSYAIRIKGPEGALVPVSRRYKSRLDLA